MNGRLPVVSGRTAIKALGSFGYTVLPNRGKGSHVALWRDGDRRPLIVPDHKELDRGTLRAILRQADVTVEQFVAAL